MKKEYQILLIFIGIIALSGVMIYIIQAQNVKTPSQAEQTLPMQQTADPMKMPPGPDQAKIRQQIITMTRMGRIRCIITISTGKTPLRHTYFSANDAKMSETESGFSTWF